MNHDPDASNDWLLALNGGAGPNAFAKLVQAKPTILYSATVATATLVQPQAGSLTRVLYPLQNLLPSYPASGQTWYQDVAGSAGGDGTVPTQSSGGPFVGDSLFVAQEFDGVGHLALTGNAAVQREILSVLGRPFTTVISTSLAKLIDLKSAWMVVFGVDPVDALLVDGQGRRLGYTQATGLLSEIPGSTYYGGADGIGILAGAGPVPAKLELNGTGSAYNVSVDGYVDGMPKGVTDSGTLAGGQAKTIDLDFSPPPPTRPQVLGVTLIDQPDPDTLRIAVDFSAAMSATAARAVANCAVDVQGSPGLHIISAQYADVGTLHRVTLTARSSAALSSGDYTVRLLGKALAGADGVPLDPSGDQAVVLLDDANAAVPVGASPGTDNLGVLGSSDLGSTPPTSIAIGDFNGDGIPDMVTVDQGFTPVGVAAKGTGSMLSLRGLGGGRFAAPVAYPLDPEFAAIKVVAADWNGDGKLDVVVSAAKSYYDDSFAESIYVFLGDGKCQFTHDPNTPLPVTHGGGFQDPVSASIDVAHNVLPGGGAEILAYQQGFFSNFGDGTPEEGEIQILGKDPFLGYNKLLTVDLGAAMNPSQILHGDCRDDIVTGDETGVYVVVTTPTGLAPAVKLPCKGLYSGTLRIGDVRDDYSNDADVTTGDLLTVFLGDGKGGFAQQPDQVTGRRGEGLAGLADSNGDGKLDALLTENWNDGPGGWPDVAGPSAWVWTGDGKGGFAQPAGGPRLLYDSTPASPALASSAIADVDGHLEALFSTAGSGQIYALSDTASGGLAASAVPGPYLGSFSPIEGYVQLDDAQPLAVADFNGDGLPDLAKLSASSVDISLGVPGGGFQPFDSDSVADGDTVQAGDLNGDGIPDLVIDGAGLSVLLGRGDGTFGPPTLVDSPSGTTPANVRLADVNGGAKLDAIVLQIGGAANGFVVYFGDGTGNLLYNPSTFVARYDDYYGGSGDRSLNVGDFDGYGKVDILDTSLDGTGLRLLKGVGNGKFVARPSYDPGLLATRYYVADLNGDGLPDAIGVTGSGVTLAADVYLNDGSGHLMKSGTTGITGQIEGGTIVDLNDDGSPDLVVSRADGGSVSPPAGAEVALNDGHGGFGPPTPLDVGGKVAVGSTVLGKGTALLAGSVTLVVPTVLQL